MSTVLDARQQVLAAEYAAGYAYSTLGPRLSDPAEQQQAGTDQQAHQALADQLSAALLAAGATPDPPQASYPLPYPIATPADARALALRLEEASAGAWRYLIAICAASAEPDLAPLRAQAVEQLAAAAVRALGWRRLATPDQPSVPFPGS